jgi:hypothetical protein
MRHRSSVWGPAALAVALTFALAFGAAPAAAQTGTQTGTQGADNSGFTIELDTTTGASGTPSGTLRNAPQGATSATVTITFSDGRTSTVTARADNNWSFQFNEVGSFGPWIQIAALANTGQGASLANPRGGGLDQAANGTFRPVFYVDPGTIYGYGYGYPLYPTGGYGYGGYGGYGYGYGGYGGYGYGYGGYGYGGYGGFPYGGGYGGHCGCW